MLTQFMTAEAIERETGVAKPVIQRAMREMEHYRRYAKTDFFGSKARAVRFVALQDYFANKAALEAGIKLDAPQWDDRERELGIVNVCEYSIRVTDKDIEELAKQIIKRIGGGLMATI